MNVRRGWLPKLSWWVWQAGHTFAGDPLRVLRPLAWLVRLPNAVGVAAVVLLVIFLWVLQCLRRRAGRLESD
jgi:hypothetical protein